MAFKICYLSTGIMDTAFDSQVLPLLNAVSGSGLDLIHISLDPFRPKLTDRYLKKRDEVNSMGIETLYFRQTPPVSRTSLIIDEKRISPAFNKWWGGEDKLVVHCRGHLNSFRGLLLRRRNPGLIHIIADLRGAVADEVLQGQRGMLRRLLMHYLRNFYQRVEKQVVRNADRILCVSNAFKKFLQANYGVDNISVIPTFVAILPSSVSPSRSGSSIGKS